MANNRNFKEQQQQSKKIVIAERDNIAAVLENGKVTDFFIHRGDVLLGDVYLATVDNILPSIDAAFKRKTFTKAKIDCASCQRTNRS